MPAPGMQKAWFLSRLFFAGKNRSEAESGAARPGAHLYKNKNKQSDLVVKASPVLGNTDLMYLRAK